MEARLTFDEGRGDVLVTPDTNGNPMRGEISGNQKPISARKKRLEELRLARRALTPGGGKKGHSTPSGFRRPAAPPAELAELQLQLSAATRTIEQQKHLIDTLSARARSDQSALNGENFAVLEGQLAAAAEQIQRLTAERDAAESRVAQVEGGLTKYWAELMEGGADLQQINEEQELQQEAIEEYEELLKSSHAELDELRAQLKVQRDARVQLDQSLETAETENQRLLAEIAELSSTLSRAQHRNCSPATGSTDSATEPLAGPAEPGGKTAKQASAAAAAAEKARAAELEAELATVRSELDGARARLAQTESDLADLGAEAKVIVAERDQASAELRVAVDEMGQENEHLIDELELHKSIAARHSVAAEAMTARYESEITAAREDRDALECELASLRVEVAAGDRSGAQARAGQSPDGANPTSLQSELSALNEAVPSGAGTPSPVKAGAAEAALKKELRILRNELTATKAEVVATNKILDTVIVKWSESIAEKMIPAEPVIKAARPQSGTTNPTLAAASGRQPSLTGPRSRREPSRWWGKGKTSKPRGGQPANRRVTSSAAAGGTAGGRKNRPPLAQLSQVPRGTHAGYRTGTGEMSRQVEHQPRAGIGHRW